MFVRFVTSILDDDSGRRQGVFQSSYTLRDSRQLPPPLQEELTQALKWFADNLKLPDRFSRGSRRHANGMAIGWFKDSAEDCIAQMHILCRILNEQGIPTEMLTSLRPGYIVFEDRQQIAAVPFADTAT